MPGPRVMVSCGEASGDLYATALMTELRAVTPGVEVCGLGGPRLRAAGAHLDADYEGISVTGLIEAASVLKRAFALRRTLIDAASSRRPDVFVAIDFPDFNFRVLPGIRALGVPVVYYVSPQLWAWRPKRLETIKKYVDRMLVIFPFEQAIYEDAGVPVDFVGHPLVDLTQPARDRADVLRGAGFDPSKPVVALLPGSRPNELRLLLPGLVDAARVIAVRIPGVQVLVARAPALASSLFAPLEALRQAGVPLAVLDQATDDVLAASDVVVTASGTATIQTALHGRPMVMVYRLSPITYAIGRAFVRVRTYGMVNLVAGRRIVPELIQDDFTPERVADEVCSLLTDPGRADAMRRDLAEVRSRLGAPGASRRAALAVADVMSRAALAKPD